MDPLDEEKIPGCLNLVFWSTFPPSTLGGEKESLTRQPCSRDKTRHIRRSLLDRCRLKRAPNQTSPRQLKIRSSRRVRKAGKRVCERNTGGAGFCGRVVALDILSISAHIIAQGPAFAPTRPPRMVMHDKDMTVYTPRAVKDSPQLRVDGSHRFVGVDAILSSVGGAVTVAASKSQVHVADSIEGIE